MTLRPLLALVAVLMLTAGTCDRATSDDDAPSYRPAVPAENATTAPLLPRHADALPASDPESFRTLLGQLRGTPVLVNVWGSWCPPCHEEMPRLVAAHAEFGDRVQFLGIDILESRPEARAFIEEQGIRFPSLFDVDDAIKASFGGYGQPTTFFFDRAGELASAWSGAISEDRLQENLRAIAG
jgi:cytochrome c biogenesis protein CcmG, thiol:disulfide interchange protein DsbE